MWIYTSLVNVHLQSLGFQLRSTTTSTSAITAMFCHACVPWRFFWWRRLILVVVVLLDQKAGSRFLWKSDSTLRISPSTIVCQPKASFTTEVRRIYLDEKSTSPLQWTTCDCGKPIKVWPQLALNLLCRCWIFYIEATHRDIAQRSRGTKEEKPMRICCTDHHLDFNTDNTYTYTYTSSSTWWPSKFRPG